MGQSRSRCAKLERVTVGPRLNLPASPAGLVPLPWHPGVEGSEAMAALVAQCRAPIDPPLLVGVDRRDPRTQASEADLASRVPESEWQRARDYRMADDRSRFLLGRVLLRGLLGAWLRCPPRAVPIHPGPHGKPHCPGGPEFNLSHSGDLVLLAVHTHRAVGVDVEQLRPELDWRPIARRVLPAEQVLHLERLRDDAESCRVFHEHWCRLEAGLKAEGLGFAARRPGHPPARLKQWMLRLPPGYVGALAAVEATTTA